MKGYFYPESVPNPVQGLLGAKSSKLMWQNSPFGLKCLEHNTHLLWGSSGKAKEKGELEFCFSFFKFYFPHRFPPTFSRTNIVNIVVRRWLRSLTPLVSEHRQRGPGQEELGSASFCKHFVSGSASVCRVDWSRTSSFLRLKPPNTDSLARLPVF